MRRHEDLRRDPASEARDDWPELCPPPSEDERRENARAIQALTVPERFRLMFNPPTDDQAGDQA